MDDRSGVDQAFDERVRLLGDGLGIQQRTVRGAAPRDLGLVLDDDRQAVERTGRSPLT